MIMTHDDWYIDGCTKVSAHYQKLYDEWTAHLPKREESTPYHSGPHSIKHFEHALGIINSQSNRGVTSALEVGFCLGHSACIMLNLGVTLVTSIEISNRPQTMLAKEAMSNEWGGQFEFRRPGDERIIHGAYDFGFIDGDHSRHAIEQDVNLMRKLGVPWVLFDDFWAHWGDTQIVMQDQGICPVAILGTMALCQFT